MKMLIVDDERHVRKLLKKVIDISGLGISELLEAGSAAEALRLIDKQKPSIILTDMRMPENDGTHLLKAMAEHSYPCKIIVISAYDDFHYMQSAVRGGSFDYLMKPVDDDELNHCLAKAVKELLAEQEDSAHADASRQRLNETLNLYWDSLFTQCIHNSSMIRQHLRQLKEMLGFHNAMSYCLVSLHMDIWAKELSDRFADRRDLFYYIVLNSANELIGSPDRAIAFRNLSKEGVIVLIVTNIEKAGDYAEEVIRFVKSRLSVPISAYISEPSTFPDRMDQLYQQTEYIAQSVNLLQWGYSGVYRIEDAMERVLVSLLSEKSHLLLIIHYGDCNGLEGYVDKLVKPMASGKVIQRKQLLLWEQELHSLKEQLLHAHQNQHPFDLGDRFAVLTHQRLEGQFDLEQLKREVVAHLRSLQIRVKERQSGKQQEMLTHIKKMIDANEGLTLNLKTLSEVVHYTPDYLSRMFKHQYGISIKDYMNQKRIAYACELLKNTELRVAEVSERLGFADDKHFSKTFKKNIGQSPSQYRQIWSKESRCEN